MSKKYTGTWNSVNEHEVPKWYDGCKFEFLSTGESIQFLPSRQEHGSLVRWRPMKNGSATILMRSGIIIP